MRWESCNSEGETWTYILTQINLEEYLTNKKRDPCYFLEFARNAFPVCLEPLHTVLWSSQMSFYSVGVQCVGAIEGCLAQLIKK